MTGLLDHVVRQSGGGELHLQEHAGRVLLIVNTATRCMLAPQLAGLQRLHETYAERGLTILAFPCNQFRDQEPGGDREIQAICAGRFAARFAILAKIEVNGPTAAPLFRDLTKALPGLFGQPKIRWNYTKFLIDRAGRPVRRFAPITPCRLLRGPIEALL
jgi:glutathione peroxidase